MRLQQVGAFMAAGPLLLLGLGGFSQVAPSSGISDADIRLFETRVRPLLVDRCSSCHGGSKQMGGLRIDTAQGFVKGGSRGPVVVSGDAEKSLLIHVVKYSGDLKMPPSGKLTDTEIETLSEWVRRGARWPTQSTAPAPPRAAEGVISPAQKKFWSFQSVRRPAVPVIRQSGATRVSPIDGFILAELARKRLQPAPLADRRALIRRATFDLTGLPPTRDEIHQFLADRSPNAFEKVVDRLLASPRYGERWGRHWLDLMRYCDSLDARSLGAPGDIGEAWRYRDWVVSAFNRDLPYDEFVKDQLAGDLRPSRTPGEFNRDGLIATTMLAIGNWGNGDADKEKIHTDIVDDQIDVISRGFMGLTIACARCHDHKFDPISTRDYYALAGFFFSTRILAKFTPKGAGEDIMRTPLASPEELEDRRRHTARIAELEQKLKAADEERRRSIAAVLRPETARYVLAAREFLARTREEGAPTLEDFSAKLGLRPFAVRQWAELMDAGAYRTMTTPVRDVLGAPGILAWKGPTDTPSATINTTPEAKSLLTFRLPPRSISIHPGPTTGVAVSWRSPLTGTIRIDGEAKDADPACGDGAIWKVVLVSGGGARELASGVFENGGGQPFRQALPSSLDAVPVRKGDSIQLQVLPNNGHACDTTVVSLTIVESASGGKWDLTADLLEDPLSGNPHRDRNGNHGVWSLLDMNTAAAALKEPLAGALADWRQTALAPGKSEADLNAAAGRLAAAFDLTDSTSPFWPASAEDLAGFPDPRARDFEAMSSELESLRKKSFPPLEFANAAQDGGIPETPYAGFHDARVHVRGSYARLGDVVPRGFPTVLARAPQLKGLKGSGRLELAEWIASPAHSLTARVMVNRLWQHHFGEGIVRTPSNFGFLGERPSNPALLDWLADEFVRSGWSIKKMHRLIMLSDAYRRSSVASPDAMRIDPDNRLFGRQNRRRLESEAIRDSLLAVSGKLDTRMGGPAERDFASPRRTIYLITIRSDRTGFGPLFDAADTTAPIDKRTVSIVAPQSLYMMNSPFVLMQAKALAERLLAEAKVGSAAAPGKREEGIIRTAYEVVYGRSATASEIEVGRRLLAAARRGRGPEVAGNVVPDLELRAWESYCQVLLCANEFMFVD